MTEMLEIVDENNIPSKCTKDRNEIHKKGLWHRVTHLWVYNNKGEILLQKRSKKKKMYAGLWTVASGGHVDPGESYSDSIVRETNEEIGIKISPKKLTELGVFKIYSKDYKTNLMDNEFTKAFAIKLNQPKFKLDSKEVSEVKFFPIDRVRIMIADNKGEHIFADDIKKDYASKVLNKIEKLSKK